MKRYFYAFHSNREAQGALKLLRKRGVRNEDLSIIPCEEASCDGLHDSLSVLVPRSGTGAATGALVGLCVSLIAVVLLPFSFNVSAFMLVAFTIGAAVLGSLISTPMDAESAASLELREITTSGWALLVVESNLRNQAIHSNAFTRDADVHLVEVHGA
jgi:hypothetical protein